MNILSINKFYWRKGGSEAVFFGEKELLEKYGHTVVPFSMKHPNNLSSSFSKYFVNEVDYNATGLINKINNGTKIIFSFEARRKMEWLLQNYQPDVAHFHIFQHQISPSVLGPLKKRGIPIIFTLHDLKPICPVYTHYLRGGICEKCQGRKFYHCVLNKCTMNSRFKSLINTVEMYLHYLLGYYQNVDKYIAVSQFYKQKMIENCFESEKIVYLPNFINVEQYPLSNEDDGYILYFGRLSEEKGIEILLNAAKHCPQVKFVIVGTGPQEEELKKAAQFLKNVYLTGFKSGSELIKLITHSAFTVIPSQWYENCPMAILESFACGKPVLGARIGGIPELIDEPEDGFCFEPKNLSDLIEKINILYNLGKKSRLEMGKHGRAKIEQKFSPVLHYEKLLDIYKRSVTSI
ncbi:MAG: glycosyltransferase family 4 protein [Pseudomonadota bacterium]